MGKTWQTKWCWYFWCAGGHRGRGGCGQQCVCRAGDNFPHQGQGVPHQLPPKKGWSLMQLTHHWFSFGGVLCRTKLPLVWQLRGFRWPYHKWTLLIVDFDFDLTIYCFQNSKGYLWKGRGGIGGQNCRNLARGWEAHLCQPLHIVFAANLCYFHQYSSKWCRNHNKI